MKTASGYLKKYTFFIMTVYLGDRCRWYDFLHQSRQRKLSL
jgi:hypothetical protein